MTDEELLFEAKKAMERAYVPYSKFKVGAALLTEDDSLYTGCNIENASYGATICAERTAISKAVSEGHTYISKIAIVSSAGEFTHPCGICRQVLAEFGDENTTIILEDKENGVMNMPFFAELPFAFTKESIK